MDQNVVFNPNFKLGLRGWHSNSCTAFVSPEKHHDPATKTTEGQFVCVVTSRKEPWHGLEQELTPRLNVNVTYSVTATVMVSNASETLTDVEATLRLESPGVHTKYLSLGKVKASGADWSKLQGSFCLDDVPNKATFYLEGPPPAIDILVKYVDIRACASSELRQQALDMKSDKCGVSQEGVEIVIRNPDFEQGLEYWYGQGCKVLLLVDTSTVERNSVSKHIAVATNRTSGWQGIAQDVTGLLKGKKKYEVSALVRIRGVRPSAEVLATLCIKNGAKKEQYITLGKVKASSADWLKLQGSFCLDDVPSKATFYLEGPPPAIDILVKYVDIRPCASSELRQQALDMKLLDIWLQSDKCGVSQEGVEIVLRNPDFEQGLEYWYGKGCKVLLLDTSTEERNSVSKHTAVATNRTSGWQGIEQDVTGLLKGKKKYEVSALVRIRGERPSAEVLATLWIKNGAQKEQYITLGKAIASSTGWVQLKGSVLLNSTPEKAAAYIEGPPAGIDLLINSFSMFSIIKPPSIRPVVKDPNFGVNIVENSSFLCGLNGWSSLGSCSLGLDTGAPLVLPPAARESLGFDLPVTGVYIAAKNRTHIWEGPSQNISGKIKLFVTYQVSAWVRIGHGGLGPQKVNVALGVDGQWVNGGEVEGDSSSWKEIAGSFRFAVEPENVLLYVQGPSANVDLMVANLMIFAVDRTARFEMLKTRTEKIRKRDAMIQVREKNGLPLSNCVVEIKQKKNTFPLGSCINSYSLEKDFYLDFFLKNFNWAVFENELKWCWTEKESNKLNYKEADELCNLCKQHGIPMRGHCIFWETEGAVQKWVKELDLNKLAAAVENRLIELVSRFQGKFEHYDVNNEMLHGSFYKDRLGKEILPYMFKLAQQFDPAPKLFVNDYHVIDGYDAHSSPEKYIQQIWDLQAMGAPIGGIGVQGHITYPVGAIISNALDKLAMVGLPIWLTEVDVESPNEFLRSDDLEVVLREAYAHPSVEGVMLWGFMETSMHRVNAHLVDADGAVNEAGKTLMTLKREWQTTSEGKTDETGCFCFRGYHGVYTVTVWTSYGGVIQKDFELGKGDNVLVVDVNC